MNIPIQNIYYLLCYAWNKLETSEKINVDTDDFETLLELFAKVLHEGTLHILKAGLDRSYINEVEALPGIKGKLLFGESLKQNMFQYGKAVCEYDELSPNILHNQILKTTIGKLLNIKGIKKELRDSLYSIYRMFHEVDEIKIVKRDFGSIRLNRNNMYYSFVMNVCELIFDSVVLNEAVGKYEFTDFRRDDKKMAALFEAFVLNFYKREIKGFKVSAPFIEWQAEALLNSSIDFLPRMETDIVLESDSKTIIIDTKFYRETMKERYEQQKISRDNLFQIFSYVKNYKKSTSALEGILLYPTVQHEVDQSFLIQGNKISVKTVNLNQPWKTIEERLKVIIA